MKKTLLFASTILFACAGVNATEYSWFSRENLKEVGGIDLSYNASWSSHYVWRGESQSSKDMSPAIGADLSHTSGFYTGLWTGAITNSAIPSEFDWYLKLPEHNLCFNEQSMRYLIRMLGWKVCHVDIVRSKLYYTCGIGKRIASRVLYYANLLTGGYLSLVLPGRYSNLFDLYSYNHINIHVNTKYN